MKPALGIIVALSFLSIPESSHGSGMENSDSKKNRHELIVSLGSMVKSGETTANGEPDKYFYHAPVISLLYLTKFQSIFGNHWEAVVGLGKDWGGIAWQFDVWPLDYLRLGAGVGVIPYFSKLPGNPILIPLPELSIGIHFQTGNMTYVGGITGNMVYGNRGTAGIGLSY